MGGNTTVYKYDKGGNIQFKKVYSYSAAYGKTYKEIENITKRLSGGYYYVKRFGSKSVKSAKKQKIGTLFKLNFGKGFWRDWAISGLSYIFSNSFSKGLNDVLQ